MYHLIRFLFLRSHILKNHFNCLAITTLAASVIFLTGCNSGNSASTTLQTTSYFAGTKNIITKAKRPTKLGDGYFIAEPGSGYDTSTHTVVSDQSCLVAANNPNNIYIANPSGYLHVGDNISMSDMQDLLGVRVSGSMNGGVFAGSMRASFLQSSENNPYTLNFTYVYQYAGVATFKPGTLGQGSAALTPVAESFAFGGDPLRFRKMCGNEFISQMNAGTTLLVTVSLDFDSYQDKHAFSLALNGRVPGIGSVTSKINDAAVSSNTSAKMSISAIQLGGDPQDLNNIFGPANNGIYPYLKCGSVNSVNPHPKACTQMMKYIIGYGQSIESQVSNPDGSINMEKMYYTDALRAKYSTLGIMANAPDPSPQVLAAAQNILSLYSTTQSNDQFVNHYINTVGNFLTVGSAGTIQDAKYHLDQQIQNIFLNPAYNVMDCYRGYISNSCPQIEANVESALAQSPYVLPQEDITLMNYFENYIYRGELLEYSGTGSDNAGNYYYGPCMLYPVSTPFNAQYVLSCTQDTFFPITSGYLSVTQSTTPAGATQLEIDGLQYNAINPLFPTFQPVINYPTSVILNQEPGFHDHFEVGGLSITGGNSYSITTGRMGLLQLPANQN